MFVRGVVRFALADAPRTDCCYNRCCVQIFLNFSPRVKSVHKGERSAFPQSVRSLRCYQRETQTHIDERLKEPPSVFSRRGAVVPSGWRFGHYKILQSVWNSSSDAPRSNLKKQAMLRSTGIACFLIIPLRYP